MTLPRNPVDDDHQAAVLAAREEQHRAKMAAHDELLDDGQDTRFLLILGIVLTLLGFAAAIGLIATVAVAWNTTGDDRYGWALLLIGAAVVGWYAYLFRKQPADGA